jgi:hypothetical protein
MAFIADSSQTQVRKAYNAIDARSPINARQRMRFA